MKTEKQKTEGLPGTPGQADPKPLRLQQQPANAMKHTPGPWLADNSNGAIDIYSHPAKVATLWGGLDDEVDVGPTTIANAHLITAAPDLLEAAKHAAMEWRLHGQLTDSCRVLERAIAKAEA